MNREKRSLFKIAVEILKYIFECCPRVTSIYILLGIIFGVMTGLSTWVMEYTFNSVTKFSIGKLEVKATILAVLLLIIFLTSQEIIIAMHSYYMNNIAERMHGFMSKKFAERTTKLAPIEFENTHILDDINKASEGTKSAFWVGNTIICAATLYLPCVVVIAFYLYKLNPLLILVVVTTVMIKMLALVIRSKLYTDLEEQAAPLRRKCISYEEAMVGKQYFKETRMLGIFNFFKRKYLTNVRLLNDKTWKANAHAANIDLITELLNGINYFAILYLLFHSLQNGWITVGAFAAVLASINELSQMIEELISDHLTVVAEDLGKISYLIDILNLSDNEGENRLINWRNDIEFKDVSFYYPGATAPSISNLSFVIKSGETIAIVGENGAGKSTLTKLLLGLYVPSDGEIILGNDKIKGVSPNVLYKGVTAVFQHYQRYQLTLKENICISAPNSNGDVYPIMLQAGVDWESRSYPEGTQTMLSREFDGVDLSGGQWQRISIARGLYRVHDFIVLDEPTAAIDPLEESRLYEKFAEISKNKTAVIVTHRLGSAQIADRIVVLDKGKIVEIGTHDSLMKQKSHYYEMYESQASWYMSKNKVDG